MKYVAAFGALLNAGVILAAPSLPAPTSRSVSLGDSQAIDFQALEDVPAGPEEAATEGYVFAANQQNVIWSGGVHTAKTGDALTSIAATFTVPTPSAPASTPTGKSSGAAWVGIDGTEGNNAGLWQAGAQWHVDTTVTPPTKSYNVWYEWFPAPLKPIQGFPVAAGDVIYVNLTAQSATTGQVVIHDMTSGQSTTISTSAPNPTATLPGKSVEWITEDLSSGGSHLPFSNYGSVAYTGCTHGSKLNPQPGFATDVRLVDIVQNGVTLSHATLVNDHQIDTKYVG